MKKRLIIIALMLAMLCAAVPAGINAFAASDVSRAEWVSHLVAAFDMTVENDDNMPDNYFSDISEDMPYYRDILLAVEFGVINIEAGEPFRPDEPATREFAAQTLNSCLLFQLDEGEGYTFSESGSVTYPDDIQVAINRGWFKLSGNNFMPEQAVTTAEMTTMLSDAKAVLASEVIDENHQNTFEFAPGVIEIPQTANTSIAADNTVTITDYDPKIKAGDIFVVYTGDLPVALKATNVTTDGNTTIISAASEGAEGAIVSGDAEGVIDLDLENFEFDETETYSVVDTSRANAAAEEFTVEAAGISWDKKTETLTGSKKIKLGGSTVGSITFVMKGMHLEFKASIGEIVIVSDDTKITTNIKVDLGDYAGIPKSLVLGNINIGGVGNISLSMEYNIEGELTYNWNGSTRTGFSFEDGYFRVIADFYKKNADLNGSAELKAGLRLSASVKSWFGSGGIYASIGVKMRAEFHSYDSGSPQLCVTTKGYMYAEVGASATIFGQNCGSKTEEIYNEYNSPIRVVYHYEDGKLVTNCARGLDLKYTTSPWSRYFNPYYGQGSYGDGGTAEPIIIWEYKVEDDGNATITKFRGNASAVSIPETIDGYTVTKIGKGAFKNNKSIQSVTMPDTIIEIVSDLDDYAFQNCTNLTYVKLSKNLTTLGYRAFVDCTALSEIEIPKSLSGTTSYYDTQRGVFVGSGLKTVTFEEGTTKVCNSLFEGADQLENVYLLDSMTTIDNNAFSGCTSLKEINLPDSLYVIGNNAFSGCTSLTALSMPDSISEIGCYSFSGCTNLSDVILSKNLSVLGYRSFMDCDSLTSIEIPKSVTNVTSYYGTQTGVFVNSGLKTATFEEGTTNIRQTLFEGAINLEYVTIPDTITTIEGSAFKGCTSLKSISIPDSVTSIGDSAFSDCTHLIQISIPDSVSIIDSYAFCGCTDLNNIKLSNNLETLGRHAFENCTSLTEIEIPKSLKNVTDYYGTQTGVFINSGLKTVKFEKGVTTIHSNLFKQAYNLENVIFTDTITSIGDNAFYQCTSLKTITIPETISEIGKYAFSGCTNLKEVNLPNTINEINAGTFQNCSSLSEITLPNTVINIWQESFQNCSSLEKIVLPNNLDKIGDSAFENCEKLKAIDIPDSVSGIGASVFRNCDTLSSVYVKNAASIGGWSFYDCDSLQTLELGDRVTTIYKELCYGCDKLTEVKLGKYITTIPDSAFRLCQSLETVNIPRFCTTIAANAFAEDTKLSSAYIPPYVTKIENNSFSYPAKMTAYGKPGSYAEEYAKSRNMKFSAVDAPITSISFAENEVFADRSKNIVLPMNITPEFDTDTITFSSSDENVATVKENGVINTKNYGTTTITASTSSGKTATCALRVLSNGTIIKFEAEKDGDTANVHIETGIVPTGATVYIAAYDRDGVMTSFTAADLADYTADTTIPTNGARKLKAFVWDPKTLAPLTTAKEINI